MPPKASAPIAGVPNLRVAPLGARSVSVAYYAVQQGFVPLEELSAGLTAGNLALRVPAERLEEVSGQLTALGATVVAS